MEKAKGTSPRALDAGANGTGPRALDSGSNARGIVLHYDLDAFFAAVEVLINPNLRGRPLVVGGMPADRGVVSTASYEARAFGIRSGMPLREAARRCPQAIFVPCRPGPYVWYSTRILKLFLSHTPRVELFSIDEAFIDGSDLARDLRGADAWAARVQEEIERRWGLTGSFGIGPNKLIAKMASKLRKPRGRTALTRAEFVEVFADRPVQDLYGVGPKTARSLAGMGVHTVGDLAKAEAATMQARFGVIGPMLVAAARGMDASPVVPYGDTPPAKSIGHEYTLERDENDRRELDRVLLGLADKVGLALRREGRRASTVHLKVRSADFTTVTRQTSLTAPVDASSDLLRHARALFRRFDAGGPVRLLGLSVSSLTAANADGPAERPESLFETDNRHRRFLQAADQVRDRYGDLLLRPAGQLSASPEAAMARRR